MGEGRKEPQSGRSGERKALHAKRGRDSPLPPLKTFLPRVGNSDFFLFDSLPRSHSQGFLLPRLRKEDIRKWVVASRFSLPLGRGRGIFSIREERETKPSLKKSSRSRSRPSARHFKPGIFSAFNNRPHYACELFQKHAVK